MFQVNLLEKKNSFIKIVKLDVKFTETYEKLNSVKFTFTIELLFVYISHKGNTWLSTYASELKEIYIKLYDDIITIYNLQTRLC